MCRKLMCVVVMIVAGALIAPLPVQSVTARDPGTQAAPKKKKYEVHHKGKNGKAKSKKHSTFDTKAAAEIKKQELVNEGYKGVVIVVR